MAAPENPDREAGTPVLPRRAAILRDLGGAFGDLGTLLPFAAGAIALGLCHPFGLLVAFGFAYLLVAVVYRLPVAVQPMKAVGAIILASAVDAQTLAASGVILGLLVAGIGVFHVVGRVVRMIPKSVIYGLQAGLGLTLGLAALRLMLAEPWIGLACAVLAAVALLRLASLTPLLVLLAGAGIGWLVGLPGLEATKLAPAPGLPILPDLPAFLDALPDLVLAQLPLTLTNAILLTEILARQYFPEGGRRVSIRRLSLTTGAMNLVAAPLGGLPLCHGAGGLAAHVRFGARSWLAPAAIGLLLLGGGLFAADLAAAALLAVPAAAVGVLLLIAGVELLPLKAFNEVKPSCRPVIAATALATVAFDPLVGLLAGGAAETLRWLILRRKEQAQTY